MGDERPAIYSSLTWNEGNKRLTHLLHNASGKHKGGWSQWQWFSWSMLKYWFSMVFLAGWCLWMLVVSASSVPLKKSTKNPLNLGLNSSRIVVFQWQVFAEGNHQALWTGTLEREDQRGTESGGLVRQFCEGKTYVQKHPIVNGEDKQPLFPPNKSSKPVTESSKDYWKMWKWWFLATVFPSS